MLPLPDISKFIMYTVTDKHEVICKSSLYTSANLVTKKVKIPIKSRESIEKQGTPLIQQTKEQTQKLETQNLELNVNESKKWNFVIFFCFKF